MPETTVTLSRRRLTFATGVQIGGRLLGAFLGVIVAASLARSLSHSQFGQLSLVLTLLTLAGSLSDLGINQIAVREMAHRPERRAGIAGALVVAQLATGTVLGLAGVAVAFVLMHGAEPRIMAVLMMATMPLGAVGAFTIAAQARLRAELVVIPILVQSVIWLAAVLVLGATHGGLALYGLGALIAAIAQAATSAVLSLGLTEVSIADTRSTILELLRLAWPIGLAGLFVTAYYRIDAIILFHYRGAAATAYYSASYRVIDVLQIFPVTVSSVLLPFLAGARRDGGSEDRVRRPFELASITLLAVAIPIAVLGAILAPGIVRLVYGTGYHRSVYLLQVLLPAFIPICLGYLLTGQLILHGMLRPYIAITGVGAILNVAVNAIGIPRYGAPVAAWSTLGTEILVMAAIATVVRRRLDLSLPARRLLRCCAAVALAGAAVWAVRSDSLIVGLMVGIVVYPPCVLATGTLSLRELRALISRDAAAVA